MIDLRPYIARIPQKTGIGTDNIYDASYPYLIQINYRAGFFTHYAGAGTLRSCKISCRGECTDLCLCRSMAKFERLEAGVRLTVDPVTVNLGGLDIVIQSVFTIEDGSGVIMTERKILNDIGDEKVTFYEYFTGGFGTTEYQADMSDVLLGVDNEKMQFSYLGRKIIKPNAEFAEIDIPNVFTKVKMYGDNDEVKVEEGIAFSPVYHLGLSKTISKGEIKTWLKLQKVN